MKRQAALPAGNGSNLRPLVAKESHCRGLGKGEFGALEPQCPEFKTQEETPSSQKEGWGRPV